MVDHESRSWARPKARDVSGNPRISRREKRDGARACRRCKNKTSELGLSGLTLEVAKRNPVNSLVTRGLRSKRSRSSRRLLRSQPIQSLTLSGPASSGEHGSGSRDSSAGNLDLTLRNNDGHVLGFCFRHFDFPGNTGCHDFRSQFVGFHSKVEVAVYFDEHPCCNLCRIPSRRQIPEHTGLDRGS